MRAYAPNGNLIIGTAEMIPATDKVDPDSVRREEDGTLTALPTGETELFYGGQYQESGEGGTLFWVGEGGETWNEREVVLGPETALVEVKESGAEAPREVVVPFEEVRGPLPEGVGEPESGEDGGTEEAPAAEAEAEAAVPGMESPPPGGEPTRNAIIRRAAEKLGLRLTRGDFWAHEESPREWHVSVRKSPALARSDD